jgi:DNA-binding LacI/PurR family transcriptional regulator
MALEEVVDQRHGLLRPMGFTKLYDTIISEVLEADYDGIFLLPPREPMSPLFLNLLKKYASRLAIVFRDMTEDGLMSLGYCGPHDVEKVWDHLYDLGHRQIAYLNTEPDSQHQQPIHELFHTWCVKRNVQAIIINEPVENFQYADVKAYAVMMQHLKRGTLKDCTAVFAHNMNIARAAIRALHEHGITIGPQMSICTQDLPRIAQLTTPSITTLDLQPMNPLIEQVLDWFAAGDKQVPPSKMLYHPNVNVLVGESTVRPSKHQSQRDCSTDN